MLELARVLGVGHVGDVLNQQRGGVVLDGVLIKPKNDTATRCRHQLADMLPSDVAHTHTHTHALVVSFALCLVYRVSSKGSWTLKGCCARE